MGRVHIPLTLAKVEAAGSSRERKRIVQGLSNSRLDRRAERVRVIKFWLYAQMEFSA
jgi:hypothetical protein